MLKTNVVAKRCTKLRFGSRSKEFENRWSSHCSV